MVFDFPHRSLLSPTAAAFPLLTLALVLSTVCAHTNKQQYFSHFLKCFSIIITFPFFI